MAKAPRLENAVSQRQWSFWSWNQRVAMLTSPKLFWHPASPPLGHDDKYNSSAMIEVLKEGRNPNASSLKSDAFNFQGNISNKIRASQMMLFEPSFSVSFFLLLKIFKAKRSKPKTMLLQRKKSSIFLRILNATRLQKMHLLHLHFHTLTLINPPL